MVRVLYKAENAHWDGEGAAESRPGRGKDRPRQGLATEASSAGLRFGPGDGRRVPRAKDALERGRRGPEKDRIRKAGSGR